MGEKRSNTCLECGYCDAVPPQILSEETLIREIVERVVSNSSDKMIPISISARHLHITQEDLEILFGKGFKLEKYRDLKQTGEFASTSQITIVGPKLKSISAVRILGPVRKFTQVELSRTDGVTLGINLPLRESSDLRDAVMLTLAGPKGSITKPCAIKAKRHIHMSTLDAQTFGVKDKDIVSIKLIGDEGGTYSSVLVRIKDNFVLEMHIDTDEANAFGIGCNAKGIIVK